MPWSPWEKLRVIGRGWLGAIPMLPGTPRGRASGAQQQRSPLVEDAALRPSELLLLPFGLCCRAPLRSPLFSVLSECRKRLSSNFPAPVITCYLGAAFDV